MKAVVFENYGPPSVLKFKEVEKPELKKDQILIRVKAVGYWDITVRKGIKRKDFSLANPVHP